MNPPPLIPPLSLPFKVMGSCILALLGVYYMARGKRDAQVSMMLMGAALVVVSFLIF